MMMVLATLSESAPAIVVVGLLVSATLGACACARGRRPWEEGPFGPTIDVPGTLVGAFDDEKFVQAGPGRIVITRETYADWVAPIYKDEAFDAGRWFDALREALRACPAWARGLPVDCDYKAEGDAIVVEILKVKQTKRGDADSASKACDQGASAPREKAKRRRKKGSC